MKRSRSGQQPALTNTQNLIVKVCDEIKEILLEKNRSYGNSFAFPIGIFAKDLTADAQIRVRIDDKLSRVSRGSDYLNEDTILDLIGYLVLLRVLDQIPKEDNNEQQHTRSNRLQIRSRTKHTKRRQIRSA